MGNIDNVGHFKTDERMMKDWSSFPLGEWTDYNVDKDKHPEMYNSHMSKFSILRVKDAELNDTYMMKMYIPSDPEAVDDAVYNGKSYKGGYTLRSTVYTVEAVKEDMPYKPHPEGIVGEIFLDKERASIWGVLYGNKRLCANWEDFSIGEWTAYRIKDDDFIYDYEKEAFDYTMVLRYKDDEGNNQYLVQRDYYASKTFNNKSTVFNVKLLEED